MRSDDVRFRIHHPEVLEPVLHLGNDRIVLKESDVVDLYSRIVRE